MTTQNYTAFIGVTPKVISLDESSTMDQVRTALGSSMASTDNFLYYNTVTDEKTVLWPTSIETTAKLSACNFPAVPSQNINTPILQIVSTAENDQALLGTSTPSGYVYNSQYFGVKIGLNEVDAAAVTNNNGMFQPVMLQNVVSANPDYPLSFQYAMICQKGAIIQFHNDKFASPKGLVEFLEDQRGLAKIKENKLVVRRDWKRDSNKIKGAFAVAKDLAEKVILESKAKKIQSSPNHPK